MPNWNIKPVSPSQPNAQTLRQITKNVNAVRNLRPQNDAFAMMSLPWGQSTIPGRRNWVIAFTDSDGIPAATDNGDGTITCGMGNAYEAYPTMDGDGNLTIGYSENTSNPFPVYNLAKNSDGAVGGDHWIVAMRLWGLWFVIWEECPE